MKKILPILLILFVSCKPYYQIYEFESINNCKIDNNSFFIHENDSVKIIYSLWAENGVLAFTFFNKLSNPLYIDWSKSSLIINGKKNNYWNDEIYTSSYTKSTDNYSKLYTYNPYLLFQKNGYSYTDTKTSKSEKITFIPPKSFVSICKFSVDYKNNLTTNDLKIKNNNVVLKRIFNYDISPVIFRNYITYSSDENITDLNFIDDHFYLSSINEFSSNDDISNFAKANSYYTKLKNGSIFNNKFEVGDKIIIKDGTNLIIAAITKVNKLSGYYSISYIDNNGKSILKDVEESYLYSNIKY